MHSMAEGWAVAMHSMAEGWAVAMHSMAEGWARASQSVELGFVADDRFEGRGDRFECLDRHIVYIEHADVKLVTNHL